MPEQIPVSYFMDITVQDVPALVFADPKKAIIITTGDFNPDYFKEYGDALAVGSEWGLTSNIYKAALAFFSQNPKPSNLMVGIHSTTIPATAYGGTTSSLETIQAITNGAIRISYTYAGESGTIDLTGLDFSGASDFSGVLSILQAAMLSAGGDLPIRYGAIGFEIYGATAWPTDIASIPATAGFLTGGSSQGLASFQGITNGGFDISIDGSASSLIRGIILGNTAATIVGDTPPTAPGSLSATDYRLEFTLDSVLYETGDIDLSSVTTQSGVVSAVNTAFGDAVIPATISYDETGDFYTITSTAKGAIPITVCTAPSGGTDLSTGLLLDANGTATAGIAQVETKTEVATRITAALTGATCSYDSITDTFKITSSTTGATSSVAAATPPITGQDLTIASALRSSLGAVSTPGLTLQTPDATVEALGLVATAQNAELVSAQTNVLIQETLANLYQKNNGWMLLSTTKELRSDYAATAGVIESLPTQIYIAQDVSSNPLFPKNGGVMKYFYDQNLQNSSASYHTPALENEYLDAAELGFLAGMRLDLENGYANLTYKTMSQVTADSIQNPDDFEDINGNFYASIGFAGEKVKDGVFPARMANGLLVSEKVANNVMQLRLQAAAFRAVAEGNNTSLGPAGQAKVRTALENEIENYWKNNGYVPSEGGSYEESDGTIVNLPKGYSFRVYTTATSRAQNQFITEGTVLKNGSVIKISGVVQIKQSA